MTEEDNGCLKFNTKSWHYKVVTYVLGKSHFRRYTFDDKWNRIPRSYDTHICEYFWTVMICCFSFPFYAIWRSLPDGITDHEGTSRIIVGWAFASAGIHFYLIFSFELYSIHEWYWGFAIFFGAIGVTLAVIGCIGLGIMISERIQKFNEKREENRKPRKYKTPKLFFEYAKARKNKICPCIKFVDDEEEKKQ